MSKYFVIADPHGFYTIMKQALDEAGFDEYNEEHKLIVCGDALDRGDECVQMVKYLFHLHSLNKLIFVLGNHEDLFPDCYYEQQHAWDISSHHIHNGTLASVKTLGSKLCKDWMEFTAKYGVDYFETEHYIFTHGWIPVEYDWLDDEYVAYYKDNWRDASYEEWVRARWLNGMELWHQGLNKTNKTVVIGHIHSSYGHSRFHNDGKEHLNKIETYYIDPDTGKEEPHVNYEPFIDDEIIALDACTVLSRKVNVVILED